MNNDAIWLAFYRGRGRLDDRVIRWATRSEFSHVEMLQTMPAGVFGGSWKGHSWSSSGRDGGVRGKEITFEDCSWEFLALPWAPPNALDAIRSEAGKPYDFAGLVGSQLFNLRRHQAERWFCSEICAHALGLELPQEFSPGSLYRHVGEMNRAFFIGKSLAGEPPEE